MIDESDPTLKDQATELSAEERVGKPEIIENPFEQDQGLRAVSESMFRRGSALIQAHRTHTVIKDTNKYSHHIESDSIEDIVPIDGAEALITFKADLSEQELERLNEEQRREVEQKGQARTRVEIIEMPGTQSDPNQKGRNIKAKVIIAVSFGALLAAGAAAKTIYDKKHN